MKERREDIGAPEERGIFFPKVNDVAFIPRRRDERSTSAENGGKSSCVHKWREGSGLSKEEFARKWLLLIH